MSDGGILRATVAEMSERLTRETERLSALAVTHGSLEVRFYAPRGEDRQPPHDRDELYVVLRGRGTYVVDGRRCPFGPGDALFAPAGSVHRFEDFGEDLAVWVMFYGPKGGEPADPG